MKSLAWPTTRRADGTGSAKWRLGRTLDVPNKNVQNVEHAIAGAISALMSRPDSTSILSTIHSPTLIIVSEEDTLTPPALSQDMQRAIGGAELVVVPRAGHLTSVEQREAFNAALAHFLEHRV
jgi:pimeloyl-ACP methyl ester carboxylesterase